MLVCRFIMNLRQFCASKHTTVAQYSSFRAATVLDNIGEPLDHGPPDDNIAEETSESISSQGITVVTSVIHGYDTTQSSLYSQQSTHKPQSKVTNGVYIYRIVVTYLYELGVHVLMKLQCPSYIVIILSAPHISIP